MAKVTFEMDTAIKKKLDTITACDKRSIQRELEWLVEEREKQITLEQVKEKAKRNYLKGK